MSKSINGEYRIEVCANSMESAVIATESGAYRIELCAAMSEGGTTPSYGEIAATRKHVNCKLNVLIRPRGGDFLYSPEELDIMRMDIEMAKSLGVDGIVIGCLNADGTVDEHAMKSLMQSAGKMSVTFHRAFDMTADPFAALETIISLGCNRILTSGQSVSAYSGTELLAKLVKQADGRISIMPGCGISAQNIRYIAENTHAYEFHMSGKGKVDSAMNYRKEGVAMGASPEDEYKRYVTNGDNINGALLALSDYKP